jgi:predicted ATP-dependent serine protease
MTDEISRILRAKYKSRPSHMFKCQTCEKDTAHKTGYCILCRERDNESGHKTLAGIQNARKSIRRKKELPPPATPVLGH